MKGAVPPTRAIVSSLIVLFVAVAGAPLLWRVAVDRWGPQVPGTPSYLPSVEKVRVRQPFDAGPIWGLQNMQPGIVVIGDSMAGRVDPLWLGERLGVRVAPVLREASGPAYWYLAFKNYVVASEITPDRTLIFFRDTNLTDLMFRFLEGHRQMVDEVATDHEPALDAAVATRLSGSWHRVHSAIDRAYALERTRTWLEPALLSWPGRVIAGRQGGALLQRAVNDRFNLEHLRPMPQSDMSVVSANDADFHANVASSVLPLLLELARAHHLKLTFVRVQRRAEDGGLRPQRPALVQYMRDLRAYIQRGGGELIDDQHDPEVAALPYDDLDHLAREGRLRYTDILARKLEALSR
jgi:hypothetical protein